MSWSFGPQTTTATSTTPIGIAIADFNGDGKGDVVVAAYGGGTSCVLLGNGDGSLKPQTTWGNTSQARNMTALDFDHDGKADFLVEQNNGTGSLFTGKGDGTFNAPTTFTASNAGNQGSVYADVSGDGNPDLLTGVYNSHALNVLLGNGNGTFLAPLKTFAVSGSDGCNGPPCVTDLNGDGKPDVLVGVLYENIKVLVGNGDGTFGAASALTGSTGGQYVDAAVLRTGHKPDVVVGFPGSAKVGIFQNDDSGNLTLNKTYATMTTPRMVKFVDLDGDGNFDLVVANSGSSSISVMLGNGNGTFLPQQTFATGAGPERFAIGDMKGDGGKDIAVANRSGNSVSVLLNSFRPAPPGVSRGTLKSRIIQ